MARFLVQRSGPLKGEVSIAGAKNAVLPLMAASLLTDEPCEIDDIPMLKDVEVMCDLLRSVGLCVSENYEEEILRTEKKGEILSEAPYELSSRMRASILIMGPILAVTGRAKMPLPGGCAIGKRPINLHLKGFRALGAEIEERLGYVEARAEKLRGANIYLDTPSVGATENIMMAAVLAEGITVIENAASEPEIIDLANFLSKMGAKIRGAGTQTIRIEGVEALHGTRHAVIPDRIELGTFMIAAAITHGEILIRNGLSNHVRPVIAKLGECGVFVEETDEGLFVSAKDREILATDIKTLPYPGFPTDMQPQFMALLTGAKGQSTVTETVFENRYMHVAELNRMGANIKIINGQAVIPGEKALSGAEVIATDLRAGAAMVLAGLSADGTTQISEIYHIERGYSHFAEKFRKLGANIFRIDD